MEKEISKETRVKEILNDRLLMKYQSIIFPLSASKLKIFSSLKLDTFCKLFNYQGSDSFVEGLNRLKEVERLENQLYPIYSDKEKVNDNSKEEVALVYFPSKKEERKPFVLLCAGGGYQYVCSIVEAFPTAKQLNALGYPVFVLHYRTKKNAHFPNPIDDIAKAIGWIIENKEKFNIEITGYSIGGFSAGGHMVASFGTSTLGYSQYKLPRPSALFLAYPVISMLEYSHKETRNSFLGEKRKDRKFQEKYSIEKQVDRDYPAVYIWTCEDDNCVSSKNSTMLVEALEKNSIPYLYNCKKGTAHGLGVGKGSEAEGWLDKAVEFWGSLNV